MPLSDFFDYPVEDAPAPAVVMEDPVLGEDWSEERWALLLRYTETMRVRAGEHLIRAGETEQALYLVEEGLLNIVLPGRRDVQFNAGPGAVLGEVAFFDSQPRSADVVALTDTQVRRLSTADVERLSARHPDVARALLMGLGRLLSFRLRRAEALARA